MSLRFYVKSKFCACFEVHIPVRVGDDRGDGLVDAVLFCCGDIFEKTCVGNLG